MACSWFSWLLWIKTCRTWRMVSVENGRLFVGTTVKRNKLKLKKNDKPKAPEMVVAVDPIGLEGLGDRLVNTQKGL